MSQQNSNATEYNRYPNHYALISSLHESFRDVSKTSKILVYGCSRGEEPVCLAEKYFTQPSSIIDAVDISEKALENAKKFNRHERVHYILTKDFEPLDKYDVIFVNSVLCSNPPQNLYNISSEYPFELFENTLEEIVDMLKVGGILMIYNSNYRIEHTTVASRFCIVTSFRALDSGFAPVYPPKGAKNMWIEIIRKSLRRGNALLQKLLGKKPMPDLHYYPSIFIKIRK